MAAGTKISVWVTGGVGLSAVLLAYAIWGQGLGVSWDSVIYLESAAALRTDLGLTVAGAGPERQPLVHYPPAYPLLLSTFGSEMRTIHARAAFANLAMWCAFLALAGALSARLAQGSQIAALCAIFMLGVHVHYLRLFARISSEGPYLVILLAAIWAVAEYGRTVDPKWLLAGGILAGVGCLFRYVGVALVLALIGTCVHSWWAERRPSARLTGAVSFVAAAPFVAIYVWNSSVLDGLEVRSFAYHPPTPAEWAVGIRAVASWVLPGTGSNLVAAGTITAGLLTAGFVALLVRWRTSGDLAVEEKLAVSFVVGYPAFVLAAMTFADDTTPLDPRILAPATAVAAILLAAWIGRSRRRGLLLLCLLWTLPQAVRSFQWAEGAHEFGIAYQKTAFLESEVTRYVADLEECVELYSNDPPAVRWLAGRHSQFFRSLESDSMPEHAALVWFSADPGDDVAIADLGLLVRDGEVAVWTRRGRPARCAGDDIR